MRFTALRRPRSFFKYVCIVCFACILSTSFVLMSTTHVFAYSLNGGRWFGTPTSGCCANLNIQFNSFGQGYDRQGFINGYGAWNGSPANVLFSTGSGALTVQDDYNPNETWDGITYYQINAFGYFMYAEAYLNSYYTRNYDAGTIQGVAAHELGHAIGLSHTNGCVLMTPSTPIRRACRITGPVSDDINGVNSLY